MYDMSKIGTKMKWEDVVAEFPDRWVAMVDCELDKITGDIIEGVLVVACYDWDLGKEVAAYHSKHPEKHIATQRTTMTNESRW